MVTAPQLTEEEARVLYTALYRMWAPMAGYDAFISAVKKLCILGGGFSCRDCSDLGTKSSHYGGFLCPKHKAEEDERFARAENEARNAAQTQGKA